MCKDMTRLLDPILYQGSKSSFTHFYNTTNFEYLSSIS